MTGAGPARVRSIKPILSGHALEGAIARKVWLEELDAVVAELSKRPGVSWATWNDSALE
jgi:hypothetical protein